MRLVESEIEDAGDLRGLSVEKMKDGYDIVSVCAVWDKKEGGWTGCALGRGREWVSWKIHGFNGSIATFSDEVFYGTDEKNAREDFKSRVLEIL